MKSSFTLLLTLLVGTTVFTATSVNARINDPMAANGAESLELDLDESSADSYWYYNDYLCFYYPGAAGCADVGYPYYGGGYGYPYYGKGYYYGGYWRGKKYGRHHGHHRGKRFGHHRGGRRGGDRHHRKGGHRGGHRGGRHHRR